MEDLSIAIENNQPIAMIFLYFKKAFDSIHRERLTTKLNMHGISGTMQSCIRNFLSQKHQILKLGNIFSNTTDVKSGVPSIVYLVLFCL